MFVGDLMLAAPDSARYFDEVRDVLRTADVTVGHVEWPHTDRGMVCVVDLPAPEAPPSNLDCLRDCGIRVATLAGNHMFDQGPFGVLDTVQGLRDRGVKPVGAGRDLAEANAPAVVNVGDLRIGFASYNAVGPRESWATPVKSGVAGVRVRDHYEIDVASPGSPPTEFTTIDEDSLASMTANLRSIRAEVDVLCVSFHKGMGFIPAILAQYERPLARAAIDAGADVVVGHHAHILRGVEVYRERPIFHGINHFVTAYTDESNPLGTKTNRPRPRRSPALDGHRPDPDLHNFPFPSDSRHTMIACVTVTAAGVSGAGFIPCYTNSQIQPVPVRAETDEAGTVEYVARITRQAGLEASLRWEGDQVVFLSSSDAPAAELPVERAV